MPSLWKSLPPAAMGLALLALTAGALGDQDKVLQFKSTSKAAMKGQQHLVMLAVTPKGRTVRLVVANTDPAGPYAPVADQLQLIQSLKPGDLIQMSWETDANVNTVGAIARYTPKPGELTLNGYLFVKAESKDPKDPDSAVLVTLNKLGELTVATESTQKDSAGKMQPDPLISATVTALKEGDPVWVELSSGPAPTIQAIMPYTDPATATIGKFAMADMNGEKAPSVELDNGNTAIVVVIPGKDVGGKWVPNVRLMAAAHRCKIGQQVLYRVQQDGATTWLRDIAPVPTQPTVAATPAPADSGPRDANGVPKGRTVGGTGMVPGVGGIGGLGGF